MGQNAKNSADFDLCPDTKTGAPHICIGIMVAASPRTVDLVRLRFHGRSNPLYRWLEQGFGAALVVLVLLDVFFTVLYARIGSGIASQRLARWAWWFFRR